MTFPSSHSPSNPARGVMAALGPMAALTAAAVPPGDVVHQPAVGEVPPAPPNSPVETLPEAPTEGWTRAPKSEVNSEDVFFDFRSAFLENPQAACKRMVDLLHDESTLTTRIEALKAARERHESENPISVDPGRESFLRELYWIANSELETVFDDQSDAADRMGRLCHHPEALELARRALIEGATAVEEVSYNITSQVGDWLEVQIDSGRLRKWAGEDVAGRFIAAWRFLEQTPDAARRHLAISDSAATARKQLMTRLALDDRLVVVLKNR